MTGLRFALSVAVALAVFTQIAAFTADPEARRAGRATAAVSAPGRHALPGAAAVPAPERHALPNATAVHTLARHALPGAAAVPAPERHARPGATAVRAPARPPYDRPPASGPLIAAHRGASRYAPENTMAAFRLAEAMGADCVELDVRATRDGRLIALHDETVDRTTDGAGRAGDLTYREIRELDAGGWFSPAFAGERIPSLEEVLDAFGGRMCLILELKQPSARPGIEEELAHALAERGLDRPERGPVVIQSFDAGSLSRMRRLLPDVAIAVLVRQRQRVMPRLLDKYRLFADAVHLPAASARKAVIRRIQGRGLAVMVWNVRDKRQLSRVLRYGVDGILTDDPLLFDNPSLTGDTLLTSDTLLTGDALLTGDTLLTGDAPPLDRRRPKLSARPDG